MDLVESTTPGAEEVGSALLYVAGSDVDEVDEVDSKYRHRGMGEAATGRIAEVRQARRAPELAQLGRKPPGPFKGTRRDRGSIADIWGCHCMYRQLKG